MKLNLPLHINSTKKNLTLGRRRSLRREKRRFQDGTGTTIINNYYITADHVTINK